MSQTPDFAAIVKQGFERILMDHYSSTVPPAPLITPMGIKHLDAILGGGITSSSYVFLSSTPETGKSTTAMQICAIFQRMYSNAVCVYLDAESAAGGTSPDIEDRINTFGINKDKFMYIPTVMNVHQIFECISKFVQLKHGVVEKTKQPCNVIVVWDSIASTPSSKDMEAEDVNSTIG